MHFLHLSATQAHKALNDFQAQIHEGAPVSEQTAKIKMLYRCFRKQIPNISAYLKKGRLYPLATQTQQETSDAPPAAYDSQLWRRPLRNTIGREDHL